MTIRQATLSDVETICRHRSCMFHDMGHIDETRRNEMTAAFRPWLERTMSAGSYLAWFVEAPDGTVAAGAGVWLMDWPPHMITPGKPRANILNVYTEREFRGQGLARLLMKNLLDWLREQQISTVILHASEAGRPIYEKLGFTSTNEMRLILE